MKKIMILSAVVALAVSAQADVAWSWWLNKADTKTDVSLGIVNECANVSTLEVSVLYSGSPVENGLQWSIFGINDSKLAKALQFSFWFNRGEESCAQVAFVNFAKNNIFNFGFLNFAEKSKIQIGLLNFDKNGFLPFFPFFNLDKSLWEDEKK